MALPLRLLDRRRLPPPLAVLSHLSAAAQRTSDRSSANAPPLPLLPRLLPFPVPARSFSWYSRSGSGSPSPPPTGHTSAESLDEGAFAEKESVYLDEASSAGYGEGLASAAADAVGVAAGGDGGVASGLATVPVLYLLDGIHSLTGLPWWITISLSTVAM